MSQQEAFKRLITTARRGFDLRQLSIPQMGKARDLSFSEAYESAYKYFEKRNLASSDELVKAVNLMLRMIDVLVETNSVNAMKYDSIMEVVDDIIEIKTQLPSDIAQKMLFELQSNNTTKVENEEEDLTEESQEENDAEPTEPEQQPEREEEPDPTF